MPAVIPDRDLWDRFLDICQRKAVPKRTQRWYVVRIERFLKAHPGRDAGGLAAADIEAYL